VAIEKQLTECTRKRHELFIARLAAGNFFAMKFPTPEATAVYGEALLGDELKTEKVVLDPNVLDHRHDRDRLFVPSLVADMCRVPFKAAAKTARFTFMKPRGQALPDTMRSPVSHAGGSAAWNADAWSLLTRFPARRPARG